MGHLAWAFQWLSFDDTLYRSSRYYRSDSSCQLYPRKHDTYYKCKRYKVPGPKTKDLLYLRTYGIYFKYLQKIQGLKTKEQLFQRTHNIYSKCKTYKAPKPRSKKFKAKKKTKEQHVQREIRWRLTIFCLDDYGRGKSIGRENAGPQII